MEKQYLYLIIGVLAGVLVGVYTARYAVNSQNYGMMGMMGMMGMRQMMSGTENINMMSSEKGHGMEMSMNEMSEMLELLTGSEFDEMFLDMMISHHQGAIDMANSALTNSQRKEIKDLANDIILAQTSEIKMMEEWMSNWFGK